MQLLDSFQLQDQTWRNLQSAKCLLFLLFPFSSSCSSSCSSFSLVALVLSFPFPLLNLPLTLYNWSVEYFKCNKTSGRKDSLKMAWATFTHLGVAFVAFWVLDFSLHVFCWFSQPNFSSFSFLSSSY